jgi:hypothetical protein
MLLQIVLLLLLSKLEMEIRPTCSLVLAFLLGFLKLCLFKVSLQSLSFFLITSKDFSNLDNGEDLCEEEV